MSFDRLLYTFKIFVTKPKQTCFINKIKENFVVKNLHNDFC